MVKKISFFFIAALLLGAGVIMANSSDFILTSESIKNNQTLPNEQVLNGFGCSGENISPDLKWQGAPEGTKSFALLVHDPDAPRPTG